MLQRGVASTAAANAAVECQVLAWALFFVVEQVWPHLGTTVTAALLRRTHADLRRTEPVMDAFDVAPEARIAVDSSRLAQPGRARDAVAEWLAMFLFEARRIVEDVADVDVRAATCLIGGALDRVGFYQALDAARTQVAARPSVGSMAPGQGVASF